MLDPCRILYIWCGYDTAGSRRYTRPTYLLHTIWKSYNIVKYLLSQHTHSLKGNLLTSLAANWLGEMSMWAKFFLAHCNSFKKYVMNIMGLHTNPHLLCEHYKVQIFRPISLKWSVSEACGCIKSPLLSIGQVWILLRIISSFEP